MTDHNESPSSSTPREQELELEVARLQAELDMLRGEDPAASTARLLAMAAETADRAVADARREADEIVVEVSSQAEARRDEATRVAAEAEAMAEQMLAEADQAQATVDQANEEAATIKATAEEEAAEIVATERKILAAEAEAFAEVRGALDEERLALDAYHESLRGRVHELAESMVSFMNTELPASSAGALDDLSVPELVAVADVSADDEGDLDLDAGAVDVDAVDEDDSELDDGDEVVDPLDTPAPVAETSVDDSLDPWVEMLENAIPEEDRIVDMPDTAIDEIPAGPPASFDGVPVIEDEDDGESSKSGGLFSRGRSNDDEVLGFDDLADDDDEDEDDEDGNGRGGLFGRLGSRLVEQTRTDELAEALDTEDTDDQAFRQFLDGDDAPDPSRDWLLRPEQS